VPAAGPVGIDGQQYPELELPRTLVPVMDLTEQLAEKIVGWSAHGLMKH
jgi:hypothetical protein